MTSPPIKSRAWRRDRVGAGVDPQATVREQRPNVSRIVLAVIGSGTSMARRVGSTPGKRLGDVGRLGQRVGHLVRRQRAAAAGARRAACRARCPAPCADDRP